MNNLILVQLWSQTLSPVASPDKLPINHRARALKRDTGRLKEEKSCLGSVVTASIVQLLLNTKERRRKGDEKIKEIDKTRRKRDSECFRQRGWKHAHRQTWTSHMSLLAVFLQESSAADRSVNKQCGTSERCAQDCVIELRMWSMAAILAYKDMMAAEKTQEEPWKWSSYIKGWMTRSVFDVGMHKAQGSKTHESVNGFCSLQYSWAQANSRFTNANTCSQINRKRTRPSVGEVCRRLWDQIGYQTKGHGRHYVIIQSQQTL